jgi:hypothetical protein
MEAAEAARASVARDEINHGKVVSSMTTLYCGATYGYISGVNLFLAALKTIQAALSAAYVVFSGGWSLRDRIKSLNLPKNLFPQSLRPVESVAR